MPIAPDPAEASALLYVRGVVEARASGMQSTAEFLDFWKAVLATAKTDPRELVTLRVIYDYHARLRGKDAQNKPIKLSDTVFTADLLEQTRILLSSPEQLEAVKKLAQAQVNKRAIGKAYYQAIATLAPGWRITREGELVGIEQVRFAHSLQF